MSSAGLLSGKPDKSPVLIATLLPKSSSCHKHSFLPSGCGYSCTKERHCGSQVDIYQCRVAQLMISKREEKHGLKSITGGSLLWRCNFLKHLLAIPSTGETIAWLRWVKIPKSCIAMVATQAWNKNHSPSRTNRNRKEKSHAKPRGNRKAFLCGTIAALHLGVNFFAFFALIGLF